MSTHQEAMEYPAGEWFTVAMLTGGEQDTECWLHLCDAALSHFSRPGDYARLTMNESRSRFRWQPRVHPGERSLRSVRHERRKEARL